MLRPTAPGSPEPVAQAPGNRTRPPSDSPACRSGHGHEQGYSGSIGRSSSRSAKTRAPEPASGVQAWQRAGSR